jgi:hypothetical protein
LTLMLPPSESNSVEVPPSILKICDEAGAASQSPNSRQNPNLSKRGIVAGGYYGVVLAWTFSSTLKFANSKTTLVGGSFCSRAISMMRLR